MNPDPEKPDHEKERLQPLQEIAAIAIATEPNEKDREMDLPKTDATKPALETENGHLSNGHLPMVDAKAQKNDAKSPLSPTPSPEIKPESQAKKPLSQVASTMPANGEIKKDKHKVVNTAAAVVVAIVTVLGFAYVIYKDEKSQTLSPQFEISNSQITPDSVIIITAANEAASRNVPLNIQFDGLLFSGAGKIIPQSQSTRWAFRLKDHSPNASQIKYGPHQMSVGFPNMPLSAPPFDIIFVATDAPQFKIKNPDTHPDSAIIIVSQNEAAARRTPLNVEFDGQPFIEAGEIISASQPPQWSFRLKAQSPPAALIRNGTHWMQVGFPGMQYSDSVKITFAGEAFAGNSAKDTLTAAAITPVAGTPKIRKSGATSVKLSSKINPGPLPPPKLAFPSPDSHNVIVGVARNEYGQNYIDRTARILTALNHHYVDTRKDKNFSGISDILTADGLVVFSQAFRNKGAFIEKRAIETQIASEENQIAVGPITIRFGDDQIPKTLYFIFTRAAEPKLKDLRLK